MSASAVQNTAGRAASHQLKQKQAKASKSKQIKLIVIVNVIVIVNLNVRVRVIVRRKRPGNLSLRKRMKTSGGSTEAVLTT